MGRQAKIASATSSSTPPAIRSSRTQGVGPVIQNQTFDCPEQIAAVEPAAPPAPLPEAGTVYFEFDKYNLTPEAQATLDDIIFDIRDRDLGGIVVNGHTDTAGPADYNMTLSQERANTVADELIQAGIPAQIVTTKAWGFTDLAVRDAARHALAGEPAGGDGLRALSRASA